MLLGRFSAADARRRAEERGLGWRVAEKRGICAAAQIEEGKGVGGGMGGEKGAGADATRRWRGS